eukprot:2793905-Rhodomonas_salina.1
MCIRDSAEALRVQALASPVALAQDLVARDGGVDGGARHEGHEEGACSSLERVLLRVLLPLPHLRLLRVQQQHVDVQHVERLHVKVQEQRQPRRALQTLGVQPVVGLFLGTPTPPHRPPPRLACEQHAVFLLDVQQRAAQHARGEGARRHAQRGASTRAHEQIDACGETERRKKERKRDRDAEGDREKGRQRERDRETERQRDREKERKRDTEPQRHTLQLRAVTLHRSSA